MRAGVSRGRVSRDMLMYTCRTAGLREDYRMTPFRVMILLRRATNTDEMSLVYTRRVTLGVLSIQFFVCLTSTII